MPIKTQMIPFGQLSPDGGEHNNPGLIQCSGFIPYGGNYVPEDLVIILSDVSDVTQNPKGGYCVSLGAYLYIPFVGTTSKIYEYNSLGAGSWEVDDVSLAAYTVGSTGWHFCQFGTHLIACPGASYANTESAIQWKQHAADANPAVRWTGGSFPGTNNCANLINAGTSTYVAKARFCAPIGERIMLGHVYELGTGVGGGSLPSGYHPDVVMWSATDDPQNFHDATTNEASLSDFQYLKDNWGPIEGLCGGSDYSLIFKSRGIYRMVTGGPFQYSFYPIPNSMGTRWSHSIVRVNYDVYFWGPSGPCVYVGLENKVYEIGLGRVSRALVDSTWISSGVPPINKGASDWLVKAAHDCSNGLIVWSIPSAATATADNLLVYNYKEDKFSVISGGTIETESEEYYLIFDNPDTDDAFSPLRDVIFATFKGVVTDQFRLMGWKSGSYETLTDATMKTGFMDFAQGKRCKVNRIRPVLSLINGQTALGFDITIDIYSRDGRWGAVTTSTNTTASMDAMGWVTFPGCPSREFHQVKFTLPTSANRQRIAEFEGFEVEFEVGGGR